MSSRKSDIVIVSRIFLPEAAAASFRLAALARSLGSGNCRIVTARPPKDLDSAELDNQFRVTHLPVWRDKDGYVKGYFSYLSFDLQAAMRVLLMPRVAGLVVEPPPTTGVFMRLVCALKRIPYIWYAADVWSDATEAMGAPPVVVKVVRLFESFTYRGAAGIIAVSDGVAERVRALGGRNVAVIPNGADTSIFNTEAATSDPDAPARHGLIHPYFIYAGTASQWQGAEIFARAFKRWWSPSKNTQCAFFARGDSLAVIEEIAAQMESSARSSGCDYAPIVVSDLVAPVQAASLQAQSIGAMVSLVPGQGYDFAYPTKILTALACGAPVLFAGPGPAISDISSERLGIAVDYDENSIVEAFATLEKENLSVADRARYALWVEEKKSMQATGRSAASFVVKSLSRKDKH